VPCGSSGIYLDEGGAVYNVMVSTFGALGHGTNDDSGPINKAISAAQNPSTSPPYAGGIVFLPPGHYLIHSPLYIDPPYPLSISIIGAGSESVIQPGSMFVEVMLQATGGSFTLTIGGHTTASIAYNATAATVAAAVNTALGLSAGTITGEPSALAKVWKSMVGMIFGSLTAAGAKTDWDRPPTVPTISTSRRPRRTCSSRSPSSLRAASLTRSRCPQRTRSNSTVDASRRT